MLSYRHAFHAGNHADVLKHLTLCLLLRRLTEKDKPCFYLDTHAACGIFALGSRFAALNQEYQNVLAAKNTAEKETEDRVRDLHKQIQDEKELTQKNIRCLKDKIQYQETQIAELQYNLGERKDAFLNKEQELMHYQMHYNVAIAQREELKKQVAELQDAYAAISNAFFSPSSCV